MTSPLAIFFVVSYFFCDFFLRFVLSLRNCHSFLTVGGVTSPEGTNTEKRKFLRKVGRNLQAMYYCCFTKTVTKSHQFCNPKNMWAFKTKTICVAHMCKHQFNMKFNYIQGPKPECEHLIMSLYIGTWGLEIVDRLPNPPKFCENSESVRFLKVRLKQ